MAPRRPFHKWHLIPQGPAIFVSLKRYLYSRVDQRPSNREDYANAKECLIEVIDQQYYESAEGLIECDIMFDHLVKRLYRRSFNEYSCAITKSSNGYWQIYVYLFTKPRATFN